MKKTLALSLIAFFAIAPMTADALVYNTGPYGDETMTENSSIEGAGIIFNSLTAGLAGANYADLNVIGTGSITGDYTSLGDLAIQSGGGLTVGGSFTADAQPTVINGDLDVEGIFHTSDTQLLTIGGTGTLNVNSGTASFGYINISNGGIANFGNSLTTVSAQPNIVNGELHITNDLSSTRITVGATGEMTVSGNTSMTYLTVSTGGTANLTGSLTTTSTTRSTVNGTLAVGNGFTSLNGIDVGSSGNLNVTGDLNSSLTVLGGGTVYVNGELNNGSRGMDSEGSITIENGLTTDGYVDIGAGTLDVLAGNTSVDGIYVGSGAVVNLMGSLTSNNSSRSSTVVGTLNVANGISMLPLDGQNYIQVQGNLNVTAGDTSLRILSVLNTANVDLGGNLIVDSSYVDGNLNVTGDVSHLANARIADTGNADIGGTFQADTLTVDAGGVLNVGTSIPASDVNIETAMTIANGITSSEDIIVNAAGTMNLEGGVSTLTSADYTNTGTTNLGSSVDLSLVNYTQSGSLSTIALDAATVGFITSSGTVSFSGGSSLTIDLTDGTNYAAGDELTLVDGALSLAGSGYDTNLALTVLNADGALYTTSLELSLDQTDLILKFTGFGGPVIPPVTATGGAITSGTAGAVTTQVSSATDNAIAARNSEVNAIKKIGKQRKKIAALYSDFSNNYYQATDNNAWAQAFGLAGRYEGDASQSLTGFDTNLGGATVGYDYDFGLIRAGGAFTFASGNIAGDGNAFDVDVQAFSASLYGVFDLDTLYIESAVSYGTTTFDQTIAGLTENFDSSNTGLLLRTGMRFYVGSFGLEPFVGLQYKNNVVDKHETGTGTVDEYNQEMFRADLGMTTSYQHMLASGNAIVPYLRIEGGYDFADVATLSSIDNAGLAIGSTQSVDFGSMMIRSAVGASFLSREKYSIGMEYEYEFRDSYQAHIGKINGRIKF